MALFKRINVAVVEVSALIEMRSEGAELRGGFHVTERDRAEVLYSERLSATERAWTLWHEAGHAIDCLPKDGRWSRSAYLKFLEAERGRVSNKCAALLEEHRGPLLAFTLTPSAEGVTAEDLMGPERWDRMLLIAKAKKPEDVPMILASKKRFHETRKAGRFLNELFAEAVACAVNKPSALPPKLRQTVEGLLEQYR